MKPKKPAGISNVAKDAPDEAVDFADQQIFAPAETIGPRPSTAPRRSLQQVLRELHDGEITAGLQTFAWGGVRVWIGDELNGRDAEGTLSPQDAAWADDASIAHWLHETAIRLFPNSDYAKRHQS